MALLWCLISHVKIQPGRKVPWGNQCSSSSAQGPNTGERGFACEIRGWLRQQWCVSGGEREVTLRCKIPKQALSWERNTDVKPFLRKMNPQIRTDKLFVNSSPDPEKFYRSMSSPHRQAFYRTWNITYRWINPFIMCNFHYCPPSRGCFQLWLTTLPSHHMWVSGASIH